jgi:hypothetical protein
MLAAALNETKFAYLEDLIAKILHCGRVVSLPELDESEIRIEDMD